VVALGCFAHERNGGVGLGLKQLEWINNE